MASASHTPILPAIASLCYPPGASMLPAAWGAAFRRDWFRAVGSVHEHRETGALVLKHSPRHPSPAFTALRDRLEATPGAVAAVLSAVRDATAGNERQMMGVC